MSIPKSKCNSKYNKYKSEAGGQTSNIRKSNRNDDPSDMKSKAQTSFTYANVRTSGVDNNRNKGYFTKDMMEKNVKLELFMIEGEESFEGKSLRGKMNVVAMRGDAEFQNWFYEKGIEGQLPVIWDDFKNIVLGYCTGLRLKI